MNIIKQYWEWEFPQTEAQVHKEIESAGRTCYKSQEKITDESALAFVKMIMSRGHDAILEFYDFKVRAITDRGITHEIVRHRIASYAQESTRYCNYSKDKFGNELTFILPNYFYEVHNAVESQTLSKINGKYEAGYFQWLHILNNCENSYMEMLKVGLKPQEARAILPNSLKTEIVMKMNIRQWKHFFSLRAAPAAHPMMQELAQSMLEGFVEKLPTLFGDMKDMLPAASIETPQVV